MIKINGRTFRTLKDPIFVNGHRVKKVLENGVRVYPEFGSGETGNMVKVYGFTNVSVSHDHKESDSAYGTIIGAGSWYQMGPGHVSFSVSAQVACIIRVLRGDVICCDHSKNTSYDDFFVPGINTSYNIPGWGSDIIGVAAPHSTRDYRSLAAPLEGLQKQATIPIWKSKNYGQIFYTFELIARCSITPVYVCGPLYYREASFGPSDYAFYTPTQNPLPHSTDFNGTIIYGKLENYYNMMGDGAWFYSVGKQGLYGDYSIQIQPGCVRCDFGNRIIDCFRIYLSGLKEEFHIVRGSNKYSGKEYHRETVEQVSMNAIEIARVPITQCIYSGMEEKAPEWAKTVSEDDLNHIINP